MDEKEKKRIEEYINTYRLYPPEYKGKKDLKLLIRMSNQYYIDFKTNLVTRLEGRIDDNGDFVIDRLYEFPFFEPDKKKPVTYKFDSIVKSYNTIVSDLGYPPCKNTYNIRDMVASLDHIRSTYNKGGEMYYLKTENYKLWYKTKKRLEWFIVKHREDALKMECTEKHDSKNYD